MDSNISFLDFCKSLKLNNPKTGFVSFDLFEHQKKLLNALEYDKLVVVKKFRQGGFTTLFALYALWKMLSEPKICCGYIGPNDRMNIYFIKIIQEVLEKMEGYDPTMFKINDHSIKFATGSSIETVRIPCCGKRIDYLFIDETKIDENIWSAIYPMVTDGKVFVMTTPVIGGEYFREIYLDIRKGKKIGHALHFNGEDFFSVTRIKEIKQYINPQQYREEVQARFTKKSKPTFKKLNQILTNLSKTHSQIEILEQVIASLYLKGTNNEKGQKSISA